MSVGTLLAILFWAVLIFVVFILPTYLLGNLVIQGLRALDRRAQEKNSRRLIGEALRTKPKRERALLKNCTNCNVFSLTLPHRDRLGRTYCSEVCAQWLDDGPRDFCESCRAETIEEEAGDLNQINGIGSAFVGSTNRCDECRSVMRRVWLTFVFIPIVPLARYRVIQASRLHFFSRRLR